MKNIVVCILLLSVLNLYAQEKAYFSASFNDAIPIGNYQSSASINHSGFAEKASSIDASFNYRFFKNFGLVSMIRYQPNMFDADKFANAYSEGVHPGYASQSIVEWKQVNVMAGGYYLLPIGKSEKFAFESRAMIGVENSYHPGIDLSQNSNTYMGTNKLNGLVLDAKSASYSSKSAFSFIYLIGLGCRYNLTSKVCLFLRLDYSSANPTFKNIQITQTNTDVLGNNYVNTTHQNIVVNVSSLNIGAGVGLRLHKSSKKS